MSTTTHHTDIAPVTGETLHRRGITGRDVGIALIDSGVTAPEAFGGRLVVGPDFTPDAGTEHHGRDRTGHGTHLAGILAGNDTGVAPGAHVLSLKVVGEGGATDVDAVIAAIDFAIAHRRDLALGVLLLTFGADQLPSGHDPLAAAIARARRAGLVPVVSAGNSGDAPLPTPAHIDEVLTVGAAEQADEAWRVCDFTTTGRDGQRADLLAPGRSVVSLLAADSGAESAPVASRVGDGFVKGTGSSQAAAVAAGAAALLREADRSLTPGDVVDILRSSARRIDAPEAGAGVLDLEVALACLASGLFNRDGRVAREVDLSTGDWTGLEWSGWSWTGLEWSGWSWTGLEWSGWSWTGWSWTGWSWTGWSWTGWSWTGLEWSGWSWTGLEWSGWSWTGWSWTGWSWTGLEWSGWSWTGLEWSGWSWTGWSWSGWSWTGLEWSGWSWTGLEWSGWSWT